jgi:hypothetical protein
MPPQGHGQPGLASNSRNPFLRPNPGAFPGYPQSRSDYEGDSDVGDGYGSANASTTRLAGSVPFYDQNSELAFTYDLDPDIVICNVQSISVIL